MQQIARLSLALVLVTLLGGAAFAKTSTKTAVSAPEYKRSDTNFYWKGDVLKVYPNAVILSADGYTQKGDSYFVPGTKKAPKEVYVQVINDWIEPITPPDMPKSLGVAPDVMQIREPQGDVQVALPTAPANFVPATANMNIPNGTVVKTGANGTAAVLFGGVNSARLIPNSEAAMQQTVTPQLRTTEIDLTVGAVFSKVGQRMGEKQDYKVHTPFGVAAARGTDFVSVAMPARTDVWIAQGTVQLDQPDGKMVGMVKSEGTGALKIVRFPVMTDMHQAMMASAETMTAAMNFIPMVNQKIKALRDKVTAGGKLSPTEQDYLNRIKKVPCLIKLALVEAVAPVVPPPTPTPAAASGPVPVVAKTPAAPAVAATAPAKKHTSTMTGPPPLNLDLRADGKVDFQGATLTPEELQSKLTELAQTKPKPSLMIQGRENMTHAQLKKVLTVCRESKLPLHLAPMPDKPKPVIATTAAPASATSAAKPAPAPIAEASTTAKPVPTEKKTPSKPASIMGAPAASGPNDTVP